MEQPDIITRVQAAADRMRRLSAAATPGTWAAVPVTYYEEQAPHYWEIHATGLPGFTEGVVTHQTHEGGGIDAKQNADYIEATQPKLGARLGELLHDIAEQMRELQGNGINPAGVISAPLLAVVDTINSFGT
jgi:hypothetical protein